MIRVIDIHNVHGFYNEYIYFALNNLVCDFLGTGASFLVYCKVRAFYGKSKQSVPLSTKVIIAGLMFLFNAVSLAVEIYRWITGSNWIYWIYPGYIVFFGISFIIMVTIVMQSIRSELRKVAQNLGSMNPNDKVLKRMTKIQVFTTICFLCTAGVALYAVFNDYGSRHYRTVDLDIVDASTYVIDRKTSIVVVTSGIYAFYCWVAWVRPPPPLCPPRKKKIGGKMYFAVKSSRGSVASKSPGRICSACNLDDRELDVGNLLRCSGCKRAYYCDGICQRVDWVKHSPFCAEGAKKLNKKKQKTNQTNQYHNCG